MSYTQVLVPLLVAINFISNAYKAYYRCVLIHSYYYIHRCWWHCC
jgi:hypothetical protein